MSEKLDIPAVDPSLTAGKMPAWQEILHAQMAEVVPMLEADEATFQAWTPMFVARRTERLSAQTVISEFGMVTKSTEQFLSPSVAMNMGAMYRSYHMDDQSAYKAAFMFLRDTYATLKDKLSPDAAYVNGAIQAAGNGQAAYFGSIAGDFAGRSMVSGDFVGEDDLPESNSIADFKNVAMCLERAAVAHNMLKILGIDSRIESGKVAVRDESGSMNEEAHAFLTVLGSDGETRFIFDPTNPIVFRNREGKIVGHKPAFYKMEDPQATRLSSDLREYSEQADGTFAVLQSREIVYTFPEAKQ